VQARHWASALLALLALAARSTWADAPEAQAATGATGTAVSRLAGTGTQTDGQDEGSAPVAPMSLADCVGYAIGHNPRIVGARSQVTAAESRIGQARSARRPHVDAASGYTNSLPQSNDPRNYWTSISLDQLLSDGGRTSALVDRARRLHDVQEQAARGVTLDVAIGTVRSYYSLVEARALLRVTELTLELAERHLLVAQGNYAAGTVARADVIRAETEVAGVRLDLVRAQASERTAVAALVTAMGMAPGTPVDVAEPGDSRSPQESPPDLQAAIGMALSRRPECLRAEADIAAAEAAVRAAEAGRKPVLSASGEVGVGDDVFPPRRPTWRVGLTFSVPLSSGGDTRARVQEARAEVATLGADAEEVRQRVALEVTDAIIAVTEAREAVVAAAEQERLARHSMEVAMGRYATGVGNSIEVKDARLAFSEALSSQVRARSRSATAVAELSAAMGLSFWEDETNL